MNHARRGVGLPRDHGVRDRCHLGDAKLANRAGRNREEVAKDNAAFSPALDNHSSDPRVAGQPVKLLLPPTYTGAIALRWPAS